MHRRKKQTLRNVRSIRILHLLRADQGLPYNGRFYTKRGDRSAVSASLTSCLLIREDDPLHKVVPDNISFS